MDPFAHIQEIKLLATLVLGFFCYRTLRKQAQQYTYQESDKELSQAQENQPISDLHQNKKNDCQNIQEERREQGSQESIKNSNFNIEEEVINDQNIIADSQNKQGQETPISSNVPSSENARKYSKRRITNRKKFIKKLAIKKIRRRKIRGEKIKNVENEC